MVSGLEGERALESKGDSWEWESNNPSSPGLPTTSIPGFRLSPRDVLRSGHQKWV